MGFLFFWEGILGTVAQSKVVVQADERTAAKAERSLLNKFVHASGGEDVAIFDKISGGVGVDEVCREIGVSRTFFYRWLKEAPERSVALARARADAADSLVEYALSLPDQATDALDMKRAELKTKSLLWTAGKWNRDVYGDTPAVQVNISTNEMHLDALRKRSTSAVIDQKD